MKPSIFFMPATLASIGERAGVGVAFSPFFWAKSELTEMRIVINRNKRFIQIDFMES
jgi:hypothetical protein